MSFLGLRPKEEKGKLEADAFALVMELLQLAKNGHPYLHLLPVLRDRAEEFPRVAILIKTLADNLRDGLPAKRR